MDTIIFYWIFVALLMVFLGTLTVIGIFFAISYRRNKNANFAVAALASLSIVTGFAGRFIFEFNSIFQEYFVFVSFVSLVIFTNMTFYRGHKGIPNLVLITVIFLGIIQIVMFTLYYPSCELSRSFEFYLRTALDVPYTFITFNWLSYSYYKAYNRLKDKEIQPWIKKRYKYIAIFSFIFSFHNLPEFFQLKGVTWGNPNNIISLTLFGITVVMIVIFSIGFAFAWLMPNWVKIKLNKGYQLVKDKELSEVELLNLIKKEMGESNRN